MEEFGKGLGVFLIFVTARRAFDGPVDGIVYGALIGAGFAFTENIQYFAIGFLEGGARLSTTLLHPRHPLAVRARHVHQRHRLALGLAARRGATASAAPSGHG